MSYKPNLTAHMPAASLNAGLRQPAAVSAGRCGHEWDSGPFRRLSPGPQTPPSEHRDILYSLMTTWTPFWVCVLPATELELENSLLRASPHPMQETLF
ncbi:cyclin-dependent kinase 2-associated protein 1 isoform X3 [Balaenoptera musculus]|uniref:Cyclin-dependent kinase 2-associated protein 1 isoform X3 n=1 Tax=Balaenoptera musculus TaxID=9771 RepID=A0A8B8V1W1_BALMU|nr:cyclin-dependent kinase 2-associated protein 1 isoform X3 [Balaenoptera musculus]